MNQDWRLALRQRKDLSIISGSQAEVAEAVKRGAELRLYMDANQYEETLYFQQTYAGEGEAFAGLMTHHHSFEHHSEPAEQPFISLFKYDTSGTFSQVKWMLGNKSLDESQSYPYADYRWFVCDRWRAVYEHDADGQTMSGDLAELKEAIRDGQSIRVGVKQLFGLDNDDISGPTHTCFLSVIQPLIQDGQALANCDVALIGPPQWPFTWREGLSLAFMKPSTSGQIVCYLTQPGTLPFRRIAPRRAMTWLVAESR